MEGLSIVKMMITDTDTGEILFRSKPTEVTFERAMYPMIFTNWLMCFYRGLSKGRNISMQLDGSRFKIPKQQDIF